MEKNKSSKRREDMDPRFLWDIEAMYPDETAWEADRDQAEQLAEAFAGHMGKLAESSEKLVSAFRAKDHLWQIVEKVYVYARMKKDEDTRISKYQAMSDKAQGLIARTSAKTSFFIPELLEMPEERLLNFLVASEELKVYEHVIRQVLREKSHVLTKPEENLIARYSELTRATNDIFSMINNADMKFGSVVDEDGDKVELTHGKYSRFLESKDRRVRKEAFETMYSAFEERKNTLAATYNYNTKTDTVTSGIRNYGSSVEAALAGDNIPISVYDNLIAIVNKNLPTLHRYMELRKRALKIDAVHMYDMYVPLVDCPLEDIPYEKAVDMILEGLTPLGEEYCNLMKQGFENGWVDVFETEGKTSGAYSFGSYDSMPYILLNYNGRLRDVFTVAHEMGHSMHSYYTRKNQPFVYGSHSIFTAEVASTVNESLLMHHLLKNEKDALRRKYLLNLHIEEFRTTVFRQTMFAEFERLTHEAVEAGESLTSEWLCKTYFDLNRAYFGEEVVCDPQIAFEWARIPHFYNAFYVYKYATGFSAAVALSNRILNKKESATEDYLAFLSTGESDDPIPLLQLAGVDMNDPGPIETAMQIFSDLVTELEELI